MGAVDLVVQVEAPRSVARGMQRIGRAGHQVGRAQPRAHLPQVPRRPARVRGGGRRGCGAARSRRRACPRLPARRAGPADRGHERGGGLTVDEIEAHRPRRLPVRRAVARAARGRAGHAGGPLPLGRVRRAAAAHRLGPRRRARVRGRDGARSLAVQNAGTIPDRGLFARRPARRRARGRAGRGDGLRGAQRPDVHARRLDLAHRGDHPRPGDRHARARARRARCRSGRARAWAGPSSWARPSAGWRASWWRRGPSRPATGCASESAFDGAGRRQPGRLPRGPGGRDRRACRATARS